MIRPIEEKDRSAYLAMTRAFYASEVVLSPIPEENMEKTFALLLEGSPYAEGFVFQEEDEVVGYALLARSWSQEAGGLVVWLEELYLSPAARGKGYGKAFLAFLEQRYPEAKRFRLEVESENERAVGLYRSRGFEFFPYEQMKKDF